MSAITTDGPRPDSPAASDDRLVLVPEAAARLRISERSVHRLLRRGHLRGSKLHGRDWRIPASAIDELIRTMYPDKLPGSPHE